MKEESSYGELKMEIEDYIFKVFKFTSVGDQSSEISDIVLREKPGWIFMTGICAGNEKVVKIGDIIIANYSFMQDLNSKKFMDGKEKKETRGAEIPNVINGMITRYSCKMTLMK